MTTPDPIDPMREQGIRLWLGASDPATDPQAAMLADLLVALDRQRVIIQGLRNELSVHERRVRVSSLSMFTEAEEAMLRFCIDAGHTILCNAPDTFTDADQKAMAYLREMIGP